MSTYTAIELVVQLPDGSRYFADSDGRHHPAGRAIDDDGQLTADLLDWLPDDCVIGLDDVSDTVVADAQPLYVGATVWRTPSLNDMVAGRRVTLGIEPLPRALTYLVKNAPGGIDLPTLEDARHQYVNRRGELVANVDVRHRPLATPGHEGDEFFQTLLAEVDWSAFSRSEVNSLTAAVDAHFAPDAEADAFAALEEAEADIAEAGWSESGGGSEAAYVRMIAAMRQAFETLSGRDVAEAKRAHDDAIMAGFQADVAALPTPELEAPAEQPDSPGTLLAMLDDALASTYDLRRGVDGMTYVVPRDPTVPAVAKELDQVAGALNLLVRERHGKLVPREVLGGFLATEAARAERDGVPVIDPQLRSVREGDTLQVDLADEAGHLVTVTADGWRVDAPTGAPSRSVFLRSALTRELPLPVPDVAGDAKARFAALLGFDPASTAWALAWGWAVASWFTDLPRPILWMGGTQGSGKSTRAEMLVNLLDPRTALGSGIPANERDFRSSVKARHLVTFDNVSKVTGGQSDSLCVLITGATFEQRRLFSNDDVAAIVVKRTGLVTSISLPAGLKPDALDRVVYLQLDRMPEGARRTKDELDAEYRALRPALLGAMFDDVAGVLRRLPAAKASDGSYPRMADYAEVLRALDMSLAERGQAAGHEGAFTGAARDNLVTVAEDDPVGRAVLVLMSGRERWEGTVQELMGVLTPPDQYEDAFWPSSPRAMGAAIDRLSEPLHAAGVALGQRKTKHARLRSLVKLPTFGFDGGEQVPVAPVITAGRGEDQGAPTF